MKIGWHLGNKKPVTDLDWEILRTVPPGVVVLLPKEGISPEDGKRILGVNPACHFIIRPYFSPREVTGPVLQEYIDFCKSCIDEWRTLPEGQKHLQVFNEPNMPRWAQWEGFGDQLEDMKRFEDCFVAAYSQLKRHDPSWLIGLTPLTPGNRDVWFPGDARGYYYFHGPSGCAENLTAEQRTRAFHESPCRYSIEIADEYYDHIYIHETREAYREGWYGLRFSRYNLYRPPKPVWITEAGFPNKDNMPEWAESSLIAWFDRLLTENVTGLALWILGDNPQWGPMWYREGRIIPTVYAIKRWRDALNNLQEEDPVMPPMRIDAAAVHIRWNIEEAIREIERGDTEAARKRLKRLVNQQNGVAYRLERNLKSV